MPIPSATPRPTPRFTSRFAPTLAWPAALLALTALRLAAAAALPLSPDEAYYWIWSQALAPGYLDHPPMVALWIRAGTALLGHTPLGLRLLAPLSAATGSLLLADAAASLLPGRPAWRAPLLLNATLMLGVGAVTLTPDTPLLFFWTAALWALARAASGSPRWWLAFGLAAGLALDSKYTAALLAPAALALLLTPPLRPHWRTPYPYLAAALALALFAPVIAWNATHAWASFAKQGGRTADFAPARALQYEAELLAGQLGLATPLLALLFAAGLWHAARSWRRPASALALALTLPGAALFLEHAVGDRVQANWPAILYPGAALAAAALPPSRLAIPATALGLLLTAVLTLQATLAPFPLPPALDPSRRLDAWDSLAHQAQAQAQADHAAFIASEEYGTASLLAWYAGPTPILAAGARQSLRWSLFALPHTPPAAPGLLLQSTRRREPPDPALWSTATPIGELTRASSGHPFETFRLFRVLPRPHSPPAPSPFSMLP